MRLISTELLEPRKLLLFLSAFLLVLFGNAAQTFAHGGEDHGDQPKVATTEKGSVSRTARVGDFEVTLKHPILEPDTATVARLFITRFASNEAFGDAAPTVEIESANGAVTQAAVEKTDTPGSYSVKIPALAEGKYTVRANLKLAGGSSNTATFSGVEFAHDHAAETAAGGVWSWLKTVLLFLVCSVILAAFAGLFYFAWRMAGEKQMQKEEVVSA